MGFSGSVFWVVASPDWALGGRAAGRCVRPGNIDPSLLLPGCCCCCCCYSQKPSPLFTIMLIPPACHSSQNGVEAKKACHIIPSCSKLYSSPTLPITETTLPTTAPLTKLPCVPQQINLVELGVKWVQKYRQVSANVVCCNAQGWRLIWRL